MPEVAHRVEQPQHAESRHVGRVLGHLEGDLDVALGGQVVDLVGLDGLERPRQAVRVDEVAVVQHQLVADVVDAPGVERAAAAHEAVHLVALLEQQLRQVAAVLAGDPRDERLLRHASDFIARVGLRQSGEAGGLGTNRQRADEQEEPTSQGNQRTRDEQRTPTNKGHQRNSWRASGGASRPPEPPQKKEGPHSRPGPRSGDARRVRPELPPNPDRSRSAVDSLQRLGRGGDPSFA